MQDEPSDLEPRSLWQGQPTEHAPLTVAEIHEKARRFQRRVRWRNLREDVAAGVVVVGLLPLLFIGRSWMMQAGAALAILGVLFVVWQLHRRGSATALPAGGEALIDFHRRELIRQRDALRTVASWYLAPVVPGMVLMILGRWFQVHAAHRPVGQDHLIIAITAMFMALVFLGIWGLNQWAAKRLQKRIDALG